MTTTHTPGSTATLTWPISEYGRTIAQRGERVEIVRMGYGEATIRIASTSTLQVVPLSDLAA